MIPTIQLDDEAKLQVLLVALALFLAASLVALCLALACCPLNKWLHARNSKRRAARQQLEWTRAGHLRANLGHYQTGGRAHQPPGWPKPAAPTSRRAAAAAASYLGPPPAYEAALRATRLQSLTGSCLTPNAARNGQPGEAGSAASPDWLKTALSASQNNSSDHFNYEDERQLDLGDYFHQPREFGAELPGGELAGAPGGRPAPQQPQPPVMLRLWVRLMEPGELVQRARAQAQADKQRLLEGQRRESAGGGGGGEAGARRLSLTRQLSIPQLFGSLMTTLASGKPADAPGCGADGEPAAAPNARERAQGAEQPLSSLSSDTNSSTANLSTGEEDKHEEASSPSSSATAATAAAARCAPVASRPSRAAARAPGPDTRRAPTNRRHSVPPIASSITSRVLHMNVASFSYVKDEQLISTKKHNQLNFHHFYARPTAAPPLANNKSKLCQLLVSICDIENLLNASRWEPRAHFRLAQHSSIYVKCEILAPKPRGGQLGQAASRLLRNPLKALAHQSSTASQTSASAAGGSKHATVDFGATISAAAMELPPPPAAGKQATGGGGQKSDISSDRPSDSTSDSSSAWLANWRHEPSADGKSIVAFSSIPKQIAQQQQLASESSGPGSRASWTSQQPQQQLDQLQCEAPVDLVQFDSVFVSPILSKALLEECCLRLRIYSQCKYVNESCLAELKLPLRQLVRAQTRDNLDAARAAHAQQQAELILDNLLANLVTASTGAPLGTLMEQISAEAREEALEAAAADWPGPAGASAGLLANWLAGGRGSLQRASSSLGSALNRLEAGRAELEAGELGDGETGEEAALAEAAAAAAGWRAECAQRLEQNYCRSLLVSHWLNHLVAPAYECQPVEEPRARLLLGLTYLPTSNRLVFNAHRAALEQPAAGAAPADKQLIKRLRLQSDTSYLLRFLMLANGRVLKRKQTSGARKPEWDSQEPVTFDLVSVSVERPTFVVCLVMRSARHHATRSLQSLTHDFYQQAPPRPPSPPLASPRARPPAGAQSDPESLRYATGPASRAPGQLTREPPTGGGGGGAKRDLVIGHLVLADEVWHELRSQPRRQLIKQFKLF